MWNYCTVLNTGNSSQPEKWNMNFKALHHISIVRVPHLVSKENDKPLSNCFLTLKRLTKDCNAASVVQCTTQGQI